MAQTSRRGVARPKPGVDPFTTANKPAWLVSVLAERQVEQDRAAQIAIARRYAEQKAARTQGGLF